MNSSERGRNSLLDMKDLQFVWRLIYKNLAVLFIIPLLSFAVGYIYTYRLIDIHGAEAQLLLKSNETYDYQDPIYKGLGAYSTYTDIQNQIRILKSRNLIGEVVDKLDIEISQFVVGRLRKQEVYYTLPFKCSLEIHDPRTYEIPIGIEIINDKSYRIEYEIGGTLKSQNGNFETVLKTGDFDILLTKLYNYDEEGLNVITKSNYEIIVHTRDHLISKYQKNLTVENIDFTSILNVKVTDELAKRGIAFLDSLCDTYVDYTKRVQLEINQNTLDNIQRQIDTVKQFIEEKEIEILKYRESNAILDIDKEGSQYFNEYFEYTEILRELEEQKSSVHLLEKYLEMDSDSRTLPPYFYIERADIYLSSLISDLRIKQSRLEMMQTQVYEENQGYKNIQKEIITIKGDIKNYLSNLKVAIQNKIDKLNMNISSQKERISDLPKSAQDILNIQRELDVNNKMYLFLLEKKTNTLITRAGIIPQVRVIEEPRSLGVVRPDKSRIKITALLIGFLIAMMISLIRILFFEKIENVAELAKVTSLNIIGGIPHVPNQMPFQTITNINPKSQVTESFRTIRTNLTFLGENKKQSKVILISSFFPGEGKTFTSSNLASMLAAADKKVLIIDFDLHKPKIHKMFGAENTIGVTSYIIGRNAIREIITPTKFEFLHIITAGPLAPNPSELILKDEVGEIIKYANDNYDYVILDTPPFGLLNDSIILGKNSDIFLVVANSKILKNKGLKIIEEIMDKVQQPEKGIILNGVKQRKFNYYYSKYIYKYNYGYSYGYGYGNGYGDNYSESKS